MQEGRRVLPATPPAQQQAKARRIYREIITAATCSKSITSKGAARAYPNTEEQSKAPVRRVPVRFSKVDREAPQPPAMRMDRHRRTRHSGGESRPEQAWAPSRQLPQPSRLPLQLKQLPLQRSQQSLRPSRRLWRLLRRPLRLLQRSLWLHFEG
mgnify:CR=1 FL=1